MKKYIIAAMLLIMGMGAFAQNYKDGEGTQHLGFNIGFSEPVLREKFNKEQEKFSSTKLPGIKAGLVYETSIIKGFGMQIGLNYTFGTKLGKLQSVTGSTTAKKKEDWFTHQIEIPIDWQYKFEVAKETWLVLYTGPTVDMGLGFSKRTTNRQINPATQKLEDKVSTLNLYKQMYSEVDYDQDGIDDRYRRLNITWGVGAGFQYQRYFLRGGYDFGIYNPYNDSFNNRTDVRRNGRFDEWSIKLGIYLWNF